MAIPFPFPCRGAGALCLLAGTAACAGEVAHSAPETGVPFDDVFSVAEEIRLSELESLPLTEITTVSETPDGGLLVVDRPSDAVWLYRPRDSTPTRIGGSGNGPGEFDDPVDAVMLRDGSVYVAVFGEPTVHRFNADLTFLRRIDTPGMFPFGLASPDGEHLIVGTRESEGAGAFVMNGDGGFSDSFYAWPDRILAVPYLRSITVDFLAASGGRVFASPSVSYPIAVLEWPTREAATLGSRPASWQEPAYDPDPGSFNGPGGRERLATWLSTLTVVSGIAALDGGELVVTHGHYPTSVSGRLRDMMRVETTVLDVYDRDGRKVFEDVPVPGPVLGGGSRLYVLTGQPPAPWTLTAYDLR